MFEDRREPERLIQPPELFELGRVLGTPGAIAAIQESKADAGELVMRHVLGFWGDTDSEDRTANEEALLNGGRIFSSYALDDSVTVWVITEADRSTTTLLLPSEY